MSKLLYILILLAFTALVFLAGWGKHALGVGPAHGAELDHAAELDAYVDWFHKNEKWSVKPRYARKAKELIPPLLKYCERYEIDPLLMAIIFSRESSWRKFRGDLGEVGPGHLMPSKWSKQFDLTTLDGQIQGSVARMRQAIDKCGSVTAAVTHYASGSCNPRKKSTEKAVRTRIRQYRAAVERFRK